MVSHDLQVVTKSLTYFVSTRELISTCLFQMLLGTPHTFTVLLQTTGSAAVRSPIH